ncbi:hypothetical protein BDR06DRAFT_957732 [Suillus hirtellus]|nr:hypothetical protein BDR06DRAFT_957732 [Suillus hirtellus]
MLRLVFSSETGDNVGLLVTSDIRFKGVGLHRVVSSFSLTIRWQNLLILSRKHWHRVVNAGELSYVLLLITLGNSHYVFASNGRSCREFSSSVLDTPDEDFSEGNCITGCRIVDTYAGLGGRIPVRFVCSVCVDAVTRANICMVNKLSQGPVSVVGDDSMFIYE